MKVPINNENAKLGFCTANWLTVEELKRQYPKYKAMLDDVMNDGGWVCAAETLDGLLVLEIN